MFVILVRIIPYVIFTIIYEGYFTFYYLINFCTRKPLLDLSEKTEMLCWFHFTLYFFSAIACNLKI